MKSYLTVVIGSRAMKNAGMSKRLYFLVAIALTTSVLFTVIAHACSDLSSIRAVVQAPCDHTSSQNEPRGKPEKDNCDAVRYGLLSTQASSAGTELSKFYSTALQDAVFVGISLRDPLPSFWRSQAPPFFGLGVSPHLSHVVLRI
jgi:hypothetical protein